MQVEQAKEEIVKLIQESTNNEFLKLIQGSKLERMMSSILANEQKQKEEEVT